MVSKHCEVYEFLLGNNVIQLEKYAVNRILLDICVAMAKNLDKYPIYRDNHLTYVLQMELNSDCQ
ncbi:hypothetical protein [Vibrio ostreicida]|uniref:hypothetical protein n=1 Tax=Vibrio ostreicida TaxID=526588 RepID=UPI0009707425|nr:hypothetical protein [Vibrio ostreicida]